MVGRSGNKASLAQQGPCHTAGIPKQQNFAFLAFHSWKSGKLLVAVGSVSLRYDHSFKLYIVLLFVLINSEAILRATSQVKHGLVPRPNFSCAL